MAFTNQNEIDFRKNINELLETFLKVNNENSTINEEKKKLNDKYNDLKKEYDDNIVKLRNENESLKELLKTQEMNLKKAVQIEPRINDFIKSITELKNISGEAKNATTEVFVRLIDEELKVIIKLADSFAKRKEKNQIDKEALNHALKSLISNDTLLKKAIELVQKIHFK